MVKPPDLHVIPSEASPKSPVGAPQDPPPTPSHPITLPGTTTEPAPGLVTPQGRWRTRLRERLSRKVTARGVDPDLVPYLERAEERADACIGEIQQTAGACGPIAMTQASLGAKFAELAEYFLDRADPSTKQGRQDILLARACADTSRLNLDGALKTAHAIANARPPASGDPLAAFLDAPASEPQGEPNDALRPKPGGPDGV